MSWIKPAKFQLASPDKMEELIKQLVQANVQQQMAHSEAMQAQQQTNDLLLQQIKALRETPTVVTQLQPAARERVRTALRKLTAEDDVEAFLAVFERTAEREGLQHDQWAEVVAPFLTGDALKAYFDLTQEDALDYKKLKGEILARMGVNVYVRAQRVYQWGFVESRAARSQAYDLLHLVKRWLQPETLTPAQIVERVVVDRFVRTLPVAIQCWVGQGDPGNLDQLVGLVERYIATQDFVRDCTPTRKPPRPSPPLAVTEEKP
ncbi:hypothetical protein GDO81_022156 [Engystomops pustulosus]|uniref:SCAN box domain-containing protein n=1 Tax=Engystomops pustulosus TaxID=76066 RepID=A0AAV6YXL4_ENGPU|nr:hypothetical protein GDO81_022156 [Engystomops pustulosus]